MFAEGPGDSIVSPEPVGEETVTVEAEPATLMELPAPSLTSAAVTLTFPEAPEICTFPTATDPAAVEPGCASRLTLLPFVVRLTAGMSTFPPVLLGPLMVNKPEQLLHASGFVVLSERAKLTPAASVIAPPVPPGVGFVASIRALLGAPGAVMLPLARATKSCPLVLKVDPLENRPPKSRSPL